MKGHQRFTKVARNLKNGNRFKQPLKILKPWEKSCQAAPKTSQTKDFFQGNSFFNCLCPKKL